MHKVRSSSLLEKYQEVGALRLGKIESVRRQVREEELRTERIERKTVRTLVQLERLMRRDKRHQEYESKV